MMVSNSILVLLSGKAEVGKTTIINHLKDNYHYTQVDAGDACKALIGMGTTTFGWCVLQYGREEALRLLKEDKKQYLHQYEQLKKYPDTRNEVIGLLEFSRCFYPDIWAKASIDFCFEGQQKCIGVAQDLEERLAIEKYFDGHIIDVKLNCTNHGEEDTRRPYDFSDVTNIDTESFTYPIEKTHQIAEEINRLVIKNLRKLDINML